MRSCYRSVTDAGYVSGRMTTLPPAPATTRDAVLPPAPDPASPWRALRGMNLGDRLYRMTLTALALVLRLLLLTLLAELVVGAWPAIKRFGPPFVWTSVWDPVAGVFGAAPMIFGTLASSLLALLLAVPLALGVAIYLTEFSPKWLRQPIAFLVELLAAIPSVVYGLWGIFVLIPFVRRADGGHDGHRQSPRHQRLGVAARLHHGRRDRQRVHRSGHRSAPGRHVRGRPRALRHHGDRERLRAPPHLARGARHGGGEPRAVSARSLRRHVTSGLMTGLVAALSFTAVLALVLILGDLIAKGASSLSWDFFTKNPVPAGQTGGGVA